MTPEQQEIQSFKKQLWPAKRDNEILKKGNSLVRYGQSVSNMISKLNKVCNTKELCDLFDHSSSSYYYQSRDKTVSESTKATNEANLFRDRLHLRQKTLVSEGHQIDIHRITTLMNKANIKAIKPKRRHYYPNTGKLHKRADMDANKIYH